MQNFSKEFKKALEVVKMNKLAIASVYEKKGSFKWEALFFFAALAVNIVLSSMLFPSGFGAIFSRYSFWPLVIPYLSLFGSVYLLCLGIEKFLGKKVDQKAVLRVLAYTSVVLWTTVIPFVFAVIGLSALSNLHFALWNLAVFFIFFQLYRLLLEKVHLKNNEALIAVISCFFAAILIQKLLGAILVGPYYKFML